MMMIVLPMRGGIPGLPIGRSTPRGCLRKPFVLTTAF